MRAIARRPASARPEGTPVPGSVTPELGKERSEHGSRTMDVVLVSMPFAEVQRPSIALGMLRACLPPEVRSEIVYGNFGLAERIGLARQRLCYCA